MINSWITVLFMIISVKKYFFCQACAHFEYGIEKQCCPMCAPGNHIHWHCTDDISTTCVPCPKFTFIDEPNGEMKCFPCSECDADRGLRVNKACILTSDTVCEPLERFYCTDKKKTSCTSALQHSECRPGQYIKQVGTGSTDTVCADCTGDTYSNGSFSSCLPHKKCEDTGLTETNPGTHSSDTECGNSSTSSAITAITIIIVLITVITVLSALVFRHIQKKRLNTSGMQETRKNSDAKDSLLTSVHGRSEEQQIMTVSDDSTQPDYTQSDVH